MWSFGSKDVDCGLWYEFHLVDTFYLLSIDSYTCTKFNQLFELCYFIFSFEFKTSHQRTL